MILQRCTKCNLPSNFPNTYFDSTGVCNHCQEKSKDFQYQGIENLKKDINRILSQSNPQRKYDCAVGFSGGRDSSYLLYFAKEILGLRTLAISVTNEYMTPCAKQNIRTITDTLGIEVHYIENTALNECSRKCIRHWANEPDAAMTITFCTGCRYGLKKIIPDYVVKQRIPLLLTGETPIEEMDYRVNLLCENKGINKKNIIFGYMKKIFRNPSYLKSPTSMYYQFIDFISWDKFKKNYSLAKIKPFYYIKYDSTMVIKKIEELGWKYDSNFNSTWRSDCYVNLVRQYFLKKIVGYNDVDIYYARLLRKNEISKDEALKRIQLESNYNEETVRHILLKHFKIDLDSIIKKCNLMVYY